MVKDIIFIKGQNYSPGIEPAKERPATSFINSNF